jgi:membrane fusion protein (multidrug efflux system)
MTSALRSSSFALGAAAVAATLLASSGCSRPAAATGDAPPAAAAVHVETADVTDQSTPVVLQLTGSLRGMKEADLAANASGRVIHTFVERGDEIKAGTIVAQLDTSAAALSLQQASVDVDTSRVQDEINKADCARYEQLKAKAAISPLEYDQSVAKCKTAPLNLLLSQARQSIAAKNVGDGTIRAPFPGIVSERYVEVGEYVQASSKVVSIVQSGDLRLQFTVPEANVAQVKMDADVSFQVAAYPDRIFHGKVRYVSGAVRETTRDLVTEAVVNNDDRSLRAGMFADVSLLTGSQVLPSVPVAAVFVRQEKKRVYVIANGQVQERILQYGPEIDGRLAVESGVKTGEKVAVGNLSNLLNGESVE